MVPAVYSFYYYYTYPIILSMEYHCGYIPLPISFKLLDNFYKQLVIPIIPYHLILCITFTYIPFMYRPDTLLT